MFTFEKVYERDQKVCYLLQVVEAIDPAVSSAGHKVSFSRVAKRFSLLSHSVDWGVPLQQVAQVLKDRLALKNPHKVWLAVEMLRKVRQAERSSRPAELKIQ